MQLWAQRVHSDGAPRGHRGAEVWVGQKAGVPMKTERQKQGRDKARSRQWKEKTAEEAGREHHAWEKMQAWCLIRFKLDCYNLKKF